MPNTSEKRKATGQGWTEEEESRKDGLHAFFKTKRHREADGASAAGTEDNYRPNTNNLTFGGNAVVPGKTSSAAQPADIPHDFDGFDGRDADTDDEQSVASYSCDDVGVEDEEPASSKPASSTNYRSLRGSGGYTTAIMSSPTSVDFLPRRLDSMGMSPAPKKKAHQNNTAAGPRITPRPAGLAVGAHGQRLDISHSKFRPSCTFCMRPHQSCAGIQTIPSTCPRRRGMEAHLYGPMEDQGRTCLPYGQGPSRGRSREKEGCNQHARQGELLVSQILRRGTQCSQNYYYPQRAV